MAAKFRTYLIFGAPGSGKATQGRTLGMVRLFFHCAGGDLSRSSDTRTPLGKVFLEHFSEGQLVPDEITVELWRRSIQLGVQSHRFLPDIDYLVLDGIPRNVCQANLMEPFIEVKKVLHLRCPDRDRIVERPKKRAVKDNRFDDANEEVIRQRLGTHDRESKPLVGSYGEEMIVNIDGTRPLVGVLNTVVTNLVGERENSYFPAEN